MDPLITSICLFFVFIIREVVFIVVPLVGFVDESPRLNHQRIIIGKLVENIQAHARKSFPFASLPVV